MREHTVFEICYLQEKVADQVRDTRTGNNLGPVGKNKVSLTKSSVKDSLSFLVLIKSSLVIFNSTVELQWLEHLWDHEN